MKNNNGLFCVISIVMNFVFILSGCAKNENVPVEETTEVTQVASQTEVVESKDITVDFTNFSLTFPENWVYSEDEYGVEFFEKTNYDQGYNGKIMGIGTTYTNPDEEYVSGPYTLLGKLNGKYYVCYKPNGVNYNYEDEKLTNNYNTEFEKVDKILETFEFTNVYNEYGYTGFDTYLSGVVENFNSIESIISNGFFARHKFDVTTDFIIRDETTMFLDSNKPLNAFVLEYNSNDMFVVFVDDEGKVEYVTYYRHRSKEISEGYLKDLTQWCLALTSVPDAPTGYFSDTINAFDYCNTITLVSNYYDDLGLYAYYINNGAGSDNKDVLAVTMVYANEEFEENFENFLEKNY